MKLIRKRFPLRMFRAKPPGAYTWPKIPVVRYPGGYSFRQLDEETFVLAGLTKIQANKFAPILRRNLQVTSPKDTGRMSRRWLSWVAEIKPGKFVILMKNREPYFRFPYHFYRGEIKWNKIFRRDFVQDAVDRIVKRLPEGESVKIRVFPKTPMPPQRKPLPTKVTEKEIPKIKPAPKPTPKVVPKPKIPVKPKVKPLPKPEVPKKEVKPEITVRTRNKAHRKKIELLKEGVQMQDREEILRRATPTAAIKKELAEIAARQKVVHKKIKILDDFVDKDIPLPPGAKEAIWPPKRKPVPLSKLKGLFNKIFS